MRIDRYEIEAEVGRGAMGIVYLAHDPRLHRQVALKTYHLPPGTSEELSAEFRERFLREARAAACLSHLNIVTVFDAGEEPGGGRPFIAMEYVPGRSLQEVLREEGVLEPERARALVGVLADALSTAHETGIVHRDIKPANILVREPDGVPKIADFGVARLSTSELTQTGAGLGSPAYMSPEQVKDNPVEGRSDLFSLAVILYEALSGHRPFSGDELSALAYSIVHETPIPIARQCPGLPPGLDSFFDRALAKAPEERFRGGREFRRALEQAWEGESQDAEVATQVHDPSGNPAGNPDPPPRHETNLGDLPPLPIPTPHRKRKWLFVGGSLLALFLAANFLWGGKASLKIEGRSTVESGQLTLLVDGEEVYSRQLDAPEATSRFWGKLLRQNHETFETWIDVSPGRHEVVARILPEGDESGYQDSLVVELERGETEQLRMVAGRTFGTPVSLKKN